MKPIPYHYLGWGGRGEPSQLLPNSLILASVPYCLLVSMGTSHWLTLIRIPVEAVWRSQSFRDWSPKQRGVDEASEDGEPGETKGATGYLEWITELSLIARCNNGAVIIRE